MKQAIVLTYFAAWKNVLKTWHNRPNLGYVDLYSGPGIYSDGSPSTPLLILKQALEDDYLVEKLIAVFNDGDPQLAAELEINIEQLPGIRRLRIKPRVCNCPVSDTAIGLRPAGPSLLFADPWGYKGLSITLIARFLETPGSDCIFFFNYNRINAGLGWKGFDEPLGQVFGQGRAEALRSRMQGLTRTERERVIIGEMQAAVKGVGARCALPFRFVSANVNRTSHHLLFASTHPLGCRIMKNVMRDHSSTIMQGLGSFEFAGAVSQSEQLILAGLGPLGLRPPEKVL